MSETPRCNSESCWLVSSGRAEVRQSELAPRKEGEARVRTLYSAISRGTEALVFHGLVPQSEYARMRAPFQDGDFPGPVKYGYINVGIVEAGPDELIGETVFCLYPHQTLYQVPASALTVIPKSLPAERAILAAGMETALNALWDSEIKVGDRVVVVGAGVIGTLAAYLANQVAGTEVLLVDIDEGKRAIADALEIPFATSADAGHEADLVFHATGHAAGLATALGAAGLEARIVELSWYGAREVAAPLGQSFHAKRLVLQSSQVGRLPASQQARWSYARRLACAMKLLGDPALDALITGESAFADLPAALGEICAPHSRALCHRVRYPASPQKES